MTGPLAPFADAYGWELKQRGYSRLTAVNQLRQMARMSRWLEAEGLGVEELSEARVQDFLRFQRAGGRERSSWSRPGLLCLLDVVRELGVSAATVPPRPSPTEVLIDCFEGYLLSERGLSAGTVRGYVRHARSFVAGLAPSDGLAHLTAGEVTAAVLRESGAVSVSATQFFVSALRSFLRFCFIEGLMEVDLSQAALAATGRRRTSLPRGITKSDAAALLACCDRRSALGRRDYALIITLLRLGLRAREVAGLGLDDIDWRAGEVVVLGKGGREDRLPLPSDVGEALADYVGRVRPRCSSRRVFVSVRAPLTAISASAVRSVVHHACLRAGLPRVGAHRLRHSTATAMLRAGAPLGEIGQVLRHRSLGTTAIYAKVDRVALVTLARPWPGRGA